MRGRMLLLCVAVTIELGIYIGKIAIRINKNLETEGILWLEIRA